MPYFNLQEILQVFFEKGEYTLGGFINLSKAFGTVGCQTLINKLQYYRINHTALKWFKSYLSNRKQYISSQELSENCLGIICGVPKNLYPNQVFSILSQTGSYFHRLLTENTHLKRENLTNFLGVFIDENLS